VKLGKGLAETLDVVLALTLVVFYKDIGVHILSLEPHTEGILGGWHRYFTECPCAGNDCVFSMIFYDWGR